uniref:hypothetical protein n=1 Tax=Paractinoplanes polyasparticus TaxID=2856853 RepID=UPI001C86143E|nr:hypothetical protein [Actinoplanes polyasparticus]
MKRSIRVLVATATVALSVAAFPAAAQAAANHNISGVTPADQSWLRYETTRTDADGTTIVFRPTQLPANGMCMSLWNTRTQTAFGSGPCWGASNYSTQVVAVNVPPGTTFKVMARQRQNTLWGNDWAGVLRY